MSPERQPAIEETPDPESEPQPATESAGGVRPPGRIGGGIEDDGSGSWEPPDDQGPSPDEWADAPIEALDLPTHVHKALARHGLLNVRQLLATDEIRIIALIRTSHVLAKLANIGEGREQSDARIKEEAYRDLRMRLSEYGVLDYASPWPGSK